MIIYDPQSGEILLSTPIALSDEAVAQNLGMYHGSKFLPDLHIDTPLDYFVATNCVVQKKPEKPSDAHVWKNRQWELDSDLKMRSVLRQRNALLVQSDWTQLPDVPLTTKQAWASYRQALRDITDQPGYPLSVVWPAAPSN